jgi:acetyltransferase-like isoleucine patch superfamily enzyme
MNRKILSRCLQMLATIAPGGNNLRPRLHALRGVSIGKDVWIGQYVYIDENHPEAVFIGDNCAINLRTSIYAHMYFGPKKTAGAFIKEVVIEDNVFVGPHCLILPGVRIGEGAVIKGGSVVSRSVPPHTLWGVPDAGPLARITVPLKPGHTYQEFVRGLRPIRKKGR